MFNKNLVLVSGVAVVAGAIGFSASKAVEVIKKSSEQKRKENAFFDILKECIEDEADYCIANGIIDKSLREKVIKQIFEDTKKFVKESEESATVFNMSPEEQKKQLSESIKKSRVLYVMNEFCA